MKPERGLERIIVVNNPREGVVERDYALGEYRPKRFYEERRERGWMTLDERIKAKETENGKA